MVQRPQTALDRHSNSLEAAAGVTRRVTGEQPDIFFVLIFEALIQSAVSCDCVVSGGVSPVVPRQTVARSKTPSRNRAAGQSCESRFTLGL